MEKEAQIHLAERREQHVRVLFERTRNEVIQRMLPMTAKTVEEALVQFPKAQQGKAASYGKTIYWGDRYIGDVWCYAMDRENTPNTMVSYCVFEPSFWNRGIATAALERFLVEVKEKFGIASVGAFLYADHAASRRVLEKNGFRFIETLLDQERESVYYERRS